MFSFGGEAHLILNPTASKGRAGGLRASVSRFFEERGLRPVWHVTQGPGHAGSIVRGLPEEVPVVAVGGDGTVHEVAAACGHGRLRLPAAAGSHALCGASAMRPLTGIKLTRPRDKLPHAALPVAYSGLTQVRVRACATDRLSSSAVRSNARETTE